MALSPADCSGDMYAGVPIAMPVAVRRESPLPLMRARYRSPYHRATCLLIDDDVVRLDVAVDDVAVVRVGESVTYFA